MFDTEEQEEKKVTQYLIPANVSTKFEIFEGFGFKEAKYVIMALTIGFLLFFITGLFTKTETFNIKEVPESRTLGLKEDANTHIKGNIVTEKKDAIPKAVRFFFIFVPGAGAYIAVKRDRSTGMSLINSIQSARGFAKKQKRYYYKYDSGTEG